MAADSSSVLKRTVCSRADYCLGCVFPARERLPEQMSHEPERNGEILEGV